MQLIKEDLQKRVEEVEEEKKKLLRNHDTSPRDVQDSLLTSRRQLEAVRQRLQLETAKFQVKLTHSLIFKHLYFITCILYSYDIRLVNRFLH